MADERDRTILDGIDPEAIMNNEGITKPLAETNPQQIEQDVTQLGKNLFQEAEKLTDPRKVPANDNSQFTHGNQQDGKSLATENISPEEAKARIDHEPSKKQDVSLEDRAKINHEEVKKPQTGDLQEKGHFSNQEVDRLAQDIWVTGKDSETGEKIGNGQQRQEYLDSKYGEGTYQQVQDRINGLNREGKLQELTDGYNARDKQPTVKTNDKTPELNQNKYDEKRNEAEMETRINKQPSRSAEDLIDEERKANEEGARQGTNNKSNQQGLQQPEKPLANDNSQFTQGKNQGPQLSSEDQQRKLAEMNSRVEHKSTKENAREMSIRDSGVEKTTNVDVNKMKGAIANNQQQFGDITGRFEALKSPEFKGNFAEELCNQIGKSDIDKNIMNLNIGGNDFLNPQKLASKILRNGTGGKAIGIAASAFGVAAGKTINPTKAVETAKEAVGLSR